MLLEGKNVLVTGGGSGIGRAICLACAAEGANVAVTDIAQANAESVVDEIVESGKQAFPFRLDVTDKASVKTQFQQAIGKLGRIDILCANAGVSTMNQVLDLTEEELVNFKVNAKGVLQLPGHLAPHD